jgi:beta-galactosidase
MGRQRNSFDFHWKFFHGDAGGGQLPEFADAAWRSADLPHDGSSEGRCSESSPSSGSGGYLPIGARWSRKGFRRAGSAQSRGVMPAFYGVYQNREVRLPVAVIDFSN